jgi:hypothetical protein
MDAHAQAETAGVPRAATTRIDPGLWTVGHLEHVVAVTGEDAIALAVDAVEIVDVKPDELESVLECLLFMILKAVLSETRLPLTALRAGPSNSFRRRSSHRGRPDQDAR